MIDEKESKSAAIAQARLWERSHYCLTNNCPFGLCFRAINQANEIITLLLMMPGATTRIFYQRDNLRTLLRMRISQQSRCFLRYPFFAIAPKDYPLEKQQLLTHKMGYKEITEVSLTISTINRNISMAMKKVLEHSIVNVLEAKSHRVTIEFDYGIKKEVQDFYPLAPLTLRW